MNWPEMEVEKLLILNVSQSAFLPIPFFVRGIHKPRGQEDGVPEMSTKVLMGMEGRGVIIKN